MASEPWNDITALLGGYPNAGDIASDVWAEYVQRNLERLIAPPRAKATNNANITTTNGAGTPVPFAGAEVYDTDGFHSTATNPSRMTIPAGLAGVYHVEAFIGYWEFIGNGTRETALVRNGSQGFARVGQPGSTASAIRQHVSADVELNDGDYVEVHVIQNSGGNMNIIYQPSEPCWLSIRYVGEL